MALLSSRIPASLQPNRLARARAELGEIPFDLTVSNPTQCGIEYPPGLLHPLADPRALDYCPEPRGPLEARQAIAAGYTRWGADVDPSRVVLCASTSEAYGFLFKLIANPGESVLFPAPSYPLFESLAGLEGITTRFYSLDPECGWRIDLAGLESAPDTTRGVVVVNPNNPTGSFVHPDDASRLQTLCARRGWALIADEVFLPYPHAGAADSTTSFARSNRCLCFTLGGLSKSIGMPQLKLSWIVASGPQPLVETALDGLDFVTDSYLSVSTPVALAADRLLDHGRSVHAAISERCAANLRILSELCGAAPTVSLLLPDGGWSAVLRVPTVIDEEELAMALLREQGVAVYPGFFFDFPRDGYLILSLLPAPQLLEGGVRRMLDCIEQVCR